MDDSDRKFDEHWRAENIALARAALREAENPRPGWAGWAQAAMRQAIMSDLARLSWKRGVLQTAQPAPKGEHSE